MTRGQARARPLPQRAADRPGGGRDSAETCWSPTTASPRSAPICRRRTEAEIVECAGLCLAPGLVDMRVQLREPGAEHMESIESGGQAAAAGGVTTMVALPNTEPPVDDVSVVEFIARRAREARLAKIHTYAAATKGLAGKELTEIGLLAANGALGFTDGVKAIADALVMRRVLSYARSSTSSSSSMPRSRVSAAPAR